MKAAIVWDPAYMEHETGGHPEGADRLSHIRAHLEEGDLWPRLGVVSPRAATVDDLLIIHSRAYVDLVRRTAESGGGWLDPDTYASPRSYDIALLAAGGALELSAGFELEEVRFALVRPPGHHALPDRAMGFCLFNNVAVAARRLLDGGCERVAIIDWDVHHGNGTQAAFITEPRVLFVSLHQWPLYPGSGWFDECGAGEGEGYTVNVPLPPGCHDGDYARAVEEVVAPIVELYRPQAILVSAGQDPHVGDPLANMSLTEDGFGWLARRVQELAQRHCHGHMGLVLEGGYERKATAHSVASILRALLDEEAPVPGGESGRATGVIEHVLDVQRAYWGL
jgi:acetoin utilization deacetylase AcuC-like enzyme